MNCCRLTVVNFSILQHKLTLLFPHFTFTVTFSDSVITTDTVKWLRQTALSLILVNTF